MKSRRPENPIQNLKTLYGIGAVRLNEKTGKAERVGGVRWKIKDGIVYDARELLADMARLVEKQKKERGITQLPQIRSRSQSTDLPFLRGPTRTLGAGP